MFPEDRPWDGTLFAVMLASAMGALFGVLAVLQYEPYSRTLLFAYFAVAALALFGGPMGYYLLTVRGRQAPGVGVASVAVLASAGFAAFLYGNGSLDRSEPRAIPFTVVDTVIGQGKVGPTYSLVIEGDGHRRKVRAAPKVFDASPVGSQVHLITHEGCYGIRWIVDLKRAD